MSHDDRAAIGGPRVLSVDALLHNAEGVYEFSPERAAEAKRMCFEGIKELVGTGACDRLIAMCGCPAVGKSAWLRLHGASLGERTVVFDDLLYSVLKRAEFLQRLADLEVKVPVGIVAIERDYDKAVASMRTRPDGVRLPLEAMERYRGLYARPSVAEGFARVQVLANDYDDETGEGGYSVVYDLRP
mmetsp:Transcript_76575/g.212703  ORF Transcript_76575/g.212703 Transcript_76575/m.212703 type:complete len:187 (-) Transcript_76575:104-664(-)